jgi:hypothetical protein
MSTLPDLDLAIDFLWKNARLIDRLRFAHLFQSGPRQAVLTALSAYQNGDGGFGHGLEPDLRGPLSQPVPVWSAFCILDEIEGFDSAMVAPALDYLTSITTEEGGVPFVLPSAKQYPHAFWWEGEENPKAALNPTAGLVGFLHKHQVAHPWLTKATEFSWAKIEAATKTEPYEMVNILSFLEFVPDQERAQLAFHKLQEIMAANDFISPDPAAEGDFHSPFNFAPTPGSLGRKLFDDDLIDRHLEALIHKQQPDGGWNVDFPIWTPITGFEWRGFYTIEVLKTLRAYGRLTGL